MTRPQEGQGQTFGLQPDHTIFENSIHDATRLVRSPWRLSGQARLDRARHAVETADLTIGGVGAEDNGMRRLGG